MFNLSVPFFLPLWRRVVLVVICVGWAGVEFLTGTPFWGVLFLAMGIMALRQFHRTNWAEVADSQ